MRWPQAAPKTMAPVKLEPAKDPCPRGEAAEGWMHVPFLEYAEAGGLSANERAIAAFLVLRIADVFHLSPRTATHPSHQIDAARRYVDNLWPRNREVDHLRSILAATTSTDEPPTTLTEALLAYADWLQEEFRLREALDVLETTLAIGRTHHALAIETRALLRRARTLRIAGHFDEAIDAYRHAGSLAVQTDDAHSERLSRIGRAITLQQLGNLPAAEQLLEGVLAAAIAADDRDAEARATHDLACNDLIQDHPDRAAIRAFRAYQLYTDAEERTRALSDAGIALQELGYDAAARDAFCLTVAQAQGAGPKIRAGLELLALEAKAGNRDAFEQRRDNLAAVAADMPPRTAVDFDIKLGYGYARFGELQLAVEHLERAVARAEKHRLNELLFRAERVLATLDRPAVVSQPSIDWETEFPEVAAVAGTLRTLLVE